MTAFAPVATRASVLRTVDTTPAKHEENGGFGYSNSNDDGKNSPIEGQ